MAIKARSKGTNNKRTPARARAHDRRLLSQAEKEDAEGRAARDFMLSFAAAIKTAETKPIPLTKTGPSTPEAAPANPLAPTGTLHGDVFTFDRPGDASLAALFASALAPWEGIEPVAFAHDALSQLSADLAGFEAATFADSGEGPLAPAIAHRLLVGIESRARVAAEVLNRLVAARSAAMAGAQ